MRHLEETNQKIEVLTVPEAAEILRIGCDTAYKQIKAGNIPSLKLGRRILVPRVPLMKLLGQQPAA